MEKNAIFASAALLLFLSFTPLLTAETVTLQYDDNVMNEWGAIAGQTVRFTVPSVGYSCKLESLSIFVEEYGDNQTMTMSIWTDDGGSLISAVGEVIFEKEATVGARNWYLVDLSDADITISPGGSFFGGWTSEDNLLGFWDTNDPNDRTLQRYIGSPWLVSPPDIDAPISAVVSYVVPELTYISPIYSTRGSRVSLMVDSNDTEFLQDGVSTIADVWLSKDGVNMLSTGFTPIDSNSLTASFDLPTDAALGSWDLYVESKLFGVIEPLDEAFTIFASPDLNRDGTIDATDIKFFSLHWLEDVNELPLDILIPDDGVGTGGQPSEDNPNVSVLLQYDDYEMEGIGTLAGQAVRFTIPSTGFPYKLESLSIFIEEFDGNQTMKVSVWEDNGGDLTSAVGNLIFEKEKTVTEPMLYTVDLSDEDITIASGGSFFGGWTSDDYLMGYWDTTDPNDRTIQKFLSSPWLVSPPDIDAPILAVVSFVPPWLNEVHPVSCARGSQLTLVVDANDADFLRDGESTVVDVWLSKDGLKIPQTDFDADDSNSLTAYFDVPANAETGRWDVYVESTLFGIMQPLVEGFTIFASADLDRDSKVNFNDYNFFSKHWQEDIVRIPKIVMIPGGEFEIGVQTSDGDPNAAKTIIDDFYMSNFEISNQEYCYFLNSAISESEAEIKVDRNVVYSSDDDGNTYPYFTCHGGLSLSQIEHNDGIFTVAEVKTRDMYHDPVVAVSWYGAVAYCNWRSVKEARDVCYDISTWDCDFTKNGYRLPTEAQWEYAARGGRYAPYSRFGLGDTISHNEANYSSSTQYIYDLSSDDGHHESNVYHEDYRSGDKPYTSPSGSFAANDYELYDMVGNVWEWCNDWHDKNYYGTDLINPPGPGTGIKKIIRGGSWQNNASLCRTASRNFDNPLSIGGYTGFRVCFRP